MHSSTVRKSIARVLTVMNQKARQSLRDFYMTKKYVPLDLRPKKTRAIRRRLSKVCHVIVSSMSFDLTQFLARGIAEDPQATQEGPELPYKEVRSQSLKRMFGIY